MKNKNYCCDEFKNFQNGLKMIILVIVLAI